MAPGPGSGGPGPLPAVGHWPWKPRPREMEPIPGPKPVWRTWWHHSPWGRRGGPGQQGVARPSDPVLCTGPGVKRGSAAPGRGGEGARGSLSTEAVASTGQAAGRGVQDSLQAGPLSSQEKTETGPRKGWLWAVWPGSRAEGRPGGAEPQGSYAPRPGRWRRWGALPSVRDPARGSGWRGLVCRGAGRPGLHAP